MDVSGSKRLDWLRRQRDQAMADVEAITSKAVDEDRDLTDSEQNTCQARRSRIENLDEDIQVEAELAQRSATYSDLVSHIGPPVERAQLVERAAQPEPPVYQTPGEYLVDFLLRGENPEAKTRFDRYLQRAVANQTTTQTPGLLPVPILGPVFIEQANRRPAISAATLRPLPAGGKTFQRPKISQYTTAGPQTAEKTELPSRTLNVDPVTVTKSTYGGVVNLSWQDRDWTDPAIMDLLVSDLAASYANATDAAFCTYFTGSVTQTQPLPATPGPADLLDALYAASGTVFAATNEMPDTWWVAPDVWGKIGSSVDTTGRQLFPTVGPNNALGTIQPTSMSGSVAGFRMVVDKNLAAGTAILGASRFIEVFETIGGQVSAIEPSILGTQIAFYGYIAWLNLVPAAFVKITGVPTLPLGASNGGNGGQPASSSPSHSAAHKKA